MHQLKTKNGHDFYVVASLLQKAIRRGDFKRAGYAANELFGIYHGFLWNRLLIISAEDCNSLVTNEIMALKLADDVINKNSKQVKNKIFVGKALAILLETSKGREGCYVADTLMREKNPDMRNAPEFNSDSESVDLDEIYVEGELFPDYVYDPHTLKGKKMGRNFKNYDFDAIENADMQPKLKQQTLFDGEQWIYDDMYNDKEEITYPGYTYKPKAFNEK